MSRVTRPRRVLSFLVLLTTACKAGGPKAPPGAPAPPDLLRPYEGQFRLLRHKGEERKVKLKAQERPAGECDVAVRVKSAVLEMGTGRFSLETVGVPNVGGRDAQCKRLQPSVELTITGLSSTPADLLAQVDEKLETPEAYLRAKGGAFDRPPGKAPGEVASELFDASAEERKLARAVTSWPQVLLSVSPVSRAPAKRVRTQAFVEFEAVVGTDGRLSNPRLKASVGDANEAAVMSSFAFWRFAPARRGDTPMGARISLRTVLRVY